jgi:hypothetical protein
LCLHCRHSGQLAFRDRRRHGRTRIDDDGKTAKCQGRHLTKRRQRLLGLAGIGKQRRCAFTQLLQAKPLITLPLAADALALSRPTDADSLAHLKQAGIVRETTSRQRGRAFVYDRYLVLLNERTEPLRRG